MYRFNRFGDLFPTVSIAGCIVGVFLGSIFNLPYYMALLLYAGAFGPLLALFSTGPGSEYKLLDVSLSTLAVLLSCRLYTLVAFLVTRRTGRMQRGILGAFLAAFIAVLAATFTFVTLVVISSFPDIISQGILANLAWYSYLPLQTLPLSVAQAIHALTGGLLGSAVALRSLRRRDIDG